MIFIKSRLLIYPRLPPLLLPLLRAPEDLDEPPPLETLPLLLELEEDGRAVDRREDEGLLGRAAGLLLGLEGLADGRELFPCGLAPGRLGRVVLGLELELGRVAELGLPLLTPSLYPLLGLVEGTPRLTPSRDAVLGRVLRTPSLEAPL